MRKAGERLREKTLAKNKEYYIGKGAYGIVYPSDVQGNVIKQWTYPDMTNKSAINEADLQAVAADMGIAPKVAGVERFTGGVGNRIEMEDVRPNFEKHKGTKFPVGRDAVRLNQQLGQLALKGIRLEDRHSDNVLYNKMTGRPMQIDFGIAGRMSDDQQAAFLANVTAEGFEAAGIGELGSILRATVMDYLEGGQVAEAMDVAKQGFSRLQKIK